ncbi:hypothetical protein [Streptomyces aurantiogriseus]|uniref:Uncharacterized protein n=1 Tax=Streptomyces aurantiogriseus TaxID=66870 RepID=A0A918L0L0_9ACTN|nr:hypothetical protein [Streptomyces aurantiogriseus]GGR64946.1 hypothetical protein GCM10010251_96860 [Streptomyces aurantiogriseus]
MSEAAPRPEITTGGEAGFDAWLAAHDDALHQRVEAALDLDAGRARIFAASVTAETIPTTEEDAPEQWAHLEAVLRTLPTASPTGLHSPLPTPCPSS